MSKNVTFSANKLAAIEWLACSKFDRRPATQAMLATELGVSDKTITRWKKDQDFKEAVTNRARELLGDDLSEIYAALRREAIKGSYQHIKLAMEMTGEYVERRELTGKDGEDLINIDFSSLSTEQLNKLLKTAESLQGAKN